MSIQSSQAPNDTNDDFWAKERAADAANRGRQADPSACGTCQANAKAGDQVEHDECTQRATLLQAPDHPSYELLAGVSLEENAKLPARFHIPVFDDCGVPNAWLCAVCQEDGAVSKWPCAVAVKQGTKVFTPSHEAETASRRQAARIAELEKQLAEFEALLNGSQPQDRMERWSAAAFAAGRVVDRNALRVYMAVADAEAKDAAETARTEALADAGDYMDSVGQKDAAYLLYTTDVPVARNMRPVPSVQCATCGEGLDDENISDFCSTRCEGAAKAASTPSHREAGAL